jgi:hypothetical protein
VSAPDEDTDYELLIIFTPVLVFLLFHRVQISSRALYSRDSLYVRLIVDCLETLPVTQ